MGKRIGIGVIGMGWMGNAHARAYLQAADRFRDDVVEPRLVVCADQVISRVQEARQRFGFERAVGAWQEVVADTAVEAVDITTSNDSHREIALAAAAAGKHIYCEKPVGRNPEETAEIERAARAAGVMTFVGYNYRWAPLVQYARQLLAQGELGEVLNYRGRFFVGYASSPHAVRSWRFQRERAGWGVLGDLMSHVVDNALMMAGPIRRVVGTARTFIPARPLSEPGSGTHFTLRAGGPTVKVENEDYAGALAEFSSGAVGTVEVSRVIDGPKCEMAFEVFGTRGALSWSFERLNELNLFFTDAPGARSGYTRILSGPEHPFHDHFNPGPGVGLGYEDLKTIEAYQFLKSIADGRQGEPGFGDALAVARVLGLISHSCESGTWEEGTGPG